MLIKMSTVLWKKFQVCKETDFGFNSPFIINWVIFLSLHFLLCKAAALTLPLKMSRQGNQLAQGLILCISSMSFFFPIFFFPSSRAGPYFFTKWYMFNEHSLCLALLIITCCHSNDLFCLFTCPQGHFYHPLRTFPITF